MTSEPLPNLSESSGSAAAAREGQDLRATAGKVGLSPDHCGHREAGDGQSLFSYLFCCYGEITLTKAT